VQPAAEDSAVDKELRESFKKIAGEDMEIDAYELQDILNAAFTKGSQVSHTLHWNMPTNDDLKIDKLHWITGTLVDFCTGNESSYKVEIKSKLMWWYEVIPSVIVFID